jgi:hypothetical protein
MMYQLFIVIKVSPTVSMSIEIFFKTIFVENNLLVSSVSMLNDLLFNSLTIGNDSGYNNSEAVFSGLY